MPSITLAKSPTIFLASTLPKKRNNPPTMHPVKSSEVYFSPFRQHILGRETCFDGPYGSQRIVYADWTASGRAYGPIEKQLQEEVLPFYGNTHTETTVTGRKMTSAYEQAKTDIKTHVHAHADDVLLFC